MDFSEICQKDLPFKPWMQPQTRRLPGVQPVEPGAWLLRDDAFAPQMAYRDHLLKTKPDSVFQTSADSHLAEQELLEVVLSELDSGYQKGREVIRPDGVAVPISGSPLLAAARLVQEDLLIMDMTGPPRLTAAVLCFPASWTLAEKFGKGLGAIHGTVEDYTEQMAKRVQRLFEAVRPEQPLWRANYFRYAQADLFQPRREGVAKPGPEHAGFVRVERQTIRKLAKTGAAVFGIHTYVVRWNQLNSEEQTQLIRYER